MEEKEQLTIKENIMNTQQQREALENALNSFGLTNLTIYPKLSQDKRLKTPKFFLNNGFQTIPVIVFRTSINGILNKVF